MMTARQRSDARVQASMIFLFAVFTLAVLHIMSLETECRRIARLAG